MQKLLFFFFHILSLVYLFIHMCNVYAFLLYSIQSYRSTISQYVFCPGTPQTTNKNTVSKLYSVFIGRFCERAFKRLLRNYLSVRPDTMNLLVFVGHQISSISLISGSDDCWGNLKKKEEKKKMWTEILFSIVRLMPLSGYIYIELHLGGQVHHCMKLECPK